VNSGVAARTAWCRGEKGASVRAATVRIDKAKATIAYAGLSLPVPDTGGRQFGVDSESPVSQPALRYSFCRLVLPLHSKVSEST